MVNQLCLWPDAALYIGDSLDPQMHSHHAVQCCIALDGEFELTWEGASGWQTNTAVEGDVNFGLFTTLTDWLLGTFYMDESRAVSSEDLGIGTHPDYPSGYWKQLIQPFRSQ